MFRTSIFHAIQIWFTKQYLSLFFDFLKLYLTRFTCGCSRIVSNFGVAVVVTRRFCQGVLVSARFCQGAWREVVGVSFVVVDVRMCGVVDRRTGEVVGVSFVVADVRRGADRRIVEVVGVSFVVVHVCRATDRRLVVKERVCRKVVGISFVVVDVRLVVDKIWVLFLGLGMYFCFPS